MTDADTADTAGEVAEVQHAGTAWGIGLATFDVDGQVLDTWYPGPFLGEPSAAAANADEQMLGELAGTDDVRRVRREVVRREIELSAPPSDAPDAYLRLHLLSHRLVGPHEQNLDGIFSCLANVAWTSLGPCGVDRFEQTRARARAEGLHVQVTSIDKFPRMTDYVVPAGVRIGDADRVRLGAHLADGTTVMHAGFVNFNAGTLGTSMVEGRVSAGVVIGDGTDIGGGASIMGTLSGGGSVVVRVGRRCLLGANSELGISLGDDCVVEAGCYVTAGTKVTTPEGDVIKARDLSGRAGLQFWRNSVSGAVEVRPRLGGIDLNAALHAN